MATQPTDPKSRPAPPVAGGALDAGGRATPEPPEAPSPHYVVRALLLWPGLDHGRLASTRGDPVRIARLVARRTSLPPETILRMLGVRTSIQPTIDARSIRDD